MFTRLQNLRQGSRSVDDYAEEFSLLLTRNEIFDSEVQLVSRFIGGLRTQIQNAMSQFDPLTVAEAHRRAVAFENQFKSSTQNWPSSSRARPPLASNEASHAHASKENNETGVTRAVGSTKQATPAEDLRRSNRPNALRCYTC
uniref:Retrotransposon gag domain-containing protein n=1 Tax=Brassica oleracea var. oleracea TaxID=109376 RepID=A0A0D2ZZG8_BRAOL